MDPQHDDRDKPSPDWTRPPEPPIHRAARKGDIEALTALIAQGADINQTANLEHDNGPHLNALTTLMVAARSIDGATVETLRWLVEHGADIHARSAGGNTAAWYAAGHGARWEFHRKAVTPDHTERLRYLLDLGLDPKERNFIGRSLLTEACEAGDPARVAILLERGAPAGVGDKQSLRPTIMQQLSEVTQDSDLTDPGSVPAGEADSYEIPLFCAARSGSVDCVRLLLEASADPATRDSSGATALMVAGSAEVTKSLLAAGVDRDATDVYGKDAFATVLEDACCSGACGPDRFKVAQTLIEAGVDIERDNRYGKSRLASAAFGHHTDAVHFLLKLGAAPDARDADGASPLHSICWQGEYSDEETNHACEEIIRALVAAGAQVDAVDHHGWTPMHLAADGDWANPTAIRTLLELGASVDPSAKEGLTPLMLAAAEGAVDCIRLLCEAGADPLKKNDHGRTACDIAAVNLETWRRMAAEGPNVMWAQMEMQMDADLAKRFYGSVDQPAKELADYIKENENHYASTLLKAEEAVAILARAATEQRLRNAPDDTEKCE